MTGVLACIIGGSAAIQASASGSFFSGSGSVSPVTTSPACVITTTGGSGSYAYAWTLSSGDATTTISSTTAASVTWSRSGAIGIYDSYWNCLVTDSVTLATATISNVQAEITKGP